MENKDASAAVSAGGSGASPQVTGAEYKTNSSAHKVNSSKDGSNKVSYGSNSPAYEQNDPSYVSNGPQYEQNDPSYASNVPQYEPDETGGGTDRDALDAEGAGGNAGDTDYERRAREDLEEIHRLFPLSRSITHISGLENAERFAYLRDLGLTVREAITLTNASLTAERGYSGHMTSSVPRRSSASEIDRHELESARDIFPSLPDGEILRLWRRVRDQA